MRMLGGRVWIEFVSMIEGIVYCVEDFLQTCFCRKSAEIRGDFILCSCCSGRHDEGQNEQVRSTPKWYVKAFDWRKWQQASVLHESDESLGDEILCICVYSGACYVVQQVCICKASWSRPDELLLPRLKPQPALRFSFQATDNQASRLKHEMPVHAPCRLPTGTFRSLHLGPDAQRP